MGDTGEEAVRERPKQHYGSVPWEPGKSRVEPETLAYLTEVSEHLATIEDAEEKELLLNNVLEELEGKELRIAADAVSSRLLETLLAPAAPRHLISFMGAFTSEDDMYKLAGRWDTVCNAVCITAGGLALQAWPAVEHTANARPHPRSRTGTRLARCTSADGAPASAAWSQLSR